MAIPEDVAAAAEVSRNIAESEDAVEAEDLSQYPASDEKVLETPSDEVEGGLEDESKAPSDKTLVWAGGVQLQIPTDTWTYQSSNEGWNLARRDGTLCGMIAAVDKSKASGATVEEMAASIPANLQKNGASSVYVVDYGNKYSHKGTHCSSYIMVSVTKGGTDYMFYYEYIESKTCVNVVMLGGPTKYTAQLGSELDAIIATIAFNPGEEI